MGAAASIFNHAGSAGRRRWQGQPFAPVLILLPATRAAAAAPMPVAQATVAPAFMPSSMDAWLERFRADPMALRIEVEREARAARLAALRHAFREVRRALLPGL